MYERKIPIDYTCGLSIAMEVAISKWKFCLLTEIHKGVVRPKDLFDAVHGISKRVLHQQLKELEFHKLITKTIYPEVPARVEYNLTADGIRVLPLLYAIDQWGLEYVPKLKKLTEEI